MIDMLRKTLWVSAAAAFLNGCASSASYAPNIVRLDSASIACPDRSEYGKSYDADHRRTILKTSLGEFATASFAPVGALGKEARILHHQLPGTAFYEQEVTMYEGNAGTIYSHRLQFPQNGSQAALPVTIDNLFSHGFDTPAHVPLYLVHNAARPFQPDTILTQKSPLAYGNRAAYWMFSNIYDSFGDASQPTHIQVYSFVPKPFADLPSVQEVARGLSCLNP